MIRLRIEAKAGTVANAADTLHRESGVSRWRAASRFALSTLTLALLYVALNGLWQSVGAQFMYIGWFLVDPAKSDASDAAKLAQGSAAREARLAPEHWRAAFRLGLLYGYLSSTQRQTADRQALRDIEGKLRDMDTQSRLLGIAVVEPLPKSVEGLLVNRFEEDRGGVAARVGRATSERLGHLFLLGAHVGDELSELELLDDFLRPPAGLYIAEHGVLAGVPEPLWRPLTRLWTLRGVLRSDKHTALAGYTSAIDALDRYLASGTPPHADAK